MKTVIEEGVRHLKQRFRLRAIEWQNACISIGFGILVLNSPDLFKAPSFQGFIGGPGFWGSAALIIGLINIAALVINGTVPKPTAALRTLSAILQVFGFLMLTIGFLASGTGTTGIATYGVLAVFGFLAACWALLDAVAPEYDQ